MTTPEIRVLIEELKKMNDQAYEQPAQSFEDYQRRLGMYQGLSLAVDLLTELLNGEDDE